MTEELHGLAGLTAAADAQSTPVQAAADPAAPPEAEPAPAQAIPSAELLRPIVGLACAALVPAWRITKAEQDQLCAAYAAVLDKYFPEGVSLGPEIGAILVTAAVVMPRLGQPMKDVAGEPKAAAQDSAAA